MGELLGALGLAWPRILLYPGGLFALATARLLAWWLGRCLGTAGEPARGIDTGPARLLALVAPLAVLALMPLAPARAFPYGLDLVAAIALLEVPRLLALRELDRERLAYDYAPLLVAATGMATAVGGAELPRLLRVPEGWLERGLLTAGAVLWLVALPRLLKHSSGLAGELRALGLLLIAVLPLLGALAALTAGLIPAGLAGWVLPPAALLLAAAALGALALLPARVRERAMPALGALILALVGLSRL